MAHHYDKPSVSNKTTLKEDQWPLLKEFKHQKIPKTLGFGSFCALFQIISFSSLHSSLILAENGQTVGLSTPDRMLPLLRLWETQAFMQWV